MDIRSVAANAYQQILKLGSGQKPADPAAETQAPAPGSDFASMVSSVLEDAVKAGKVSEEQALKAIAGKADITEIVAAVSNAEMALETVVAVRDRVISAYQEIIRMPI
jgi:flagellar hook-basal body complex protein FliE